MPSALRIRGLSTAVRVIKAACKVWGAFAPGIRVFVPVGSRPQFDTVATLLNDACDIVTGINYSDTSSGTNAPWGA